MKIDPNDVRRFCAAALLVAQAIGIPAALAALTIFAVYLRQGTLVRALRGTCLILAACLLIQAAVVAQLRIGSPDVSLKWFLVAAILGEGMVLGLAGFAAFDSTLRYIALAASALAPLMLMCIRNVER